MKRNIKKLYIILHFIYKAVINSKARKKLLEASYGNTIVVPVDEYVELLRKDRFIENYNIAYSRCPKCGELKRKWDKCWFCGTP